MYYHFDTDDVKHAKAALLLYAMYRSRDRQSSLSGVDTWKRFTAFIRGASLKSSTMAEFVQAFCKKAQVSAILPKYLDTGEPVPVSNGELLLADGVHDYRMDIFADDSLLPLFNRESVYLTLLVRERIQREKLDGETNED